MAVYKTLIIDQGSDFTFLVDLNTSLDLNNCVARGQVKKTYTSSTATDFYISIDVNNNDLSATLSALQTSALKAGRYVYDIEIVSNDSPAIVQRVIEGQIDITPRVTTG